MALGGRIVTWFNGAWHDENTPIMRAADHGTWQGTLVFDGARTFEGVTPDLDLHSARIVNSARSMYMNAPVDAATVEGLIREGIAMFPANAALYLRPMMWSVEGAKSIIDADPDSTAFAICIEEYPMAVPGEFALTVSPFRRPRQDTAMTEAKAASLYPNNGRIVREAKSRGFNNALSMDLDDNVAETSSTNVFMVRDGEFFTPKPNGTFLNGITRQRVIRLLQDDGFTVHEASLSVADFSAADEIFLTGNASKVMPVTRFEDRSLKTAMGMKVREIYWDYAHSKP